jgi:hypothetical protein
VFSSLVLIPAMVNVSVANVFVADDTAGYARNGHAHTALLFTPVHRLCHQIDHHVYTRGLGADFFFAVCSVSTLYSI